MWSIPFLPLLRKNMPLTYNSEALIRKMGLRRWREGDKWRKQHQHIYTIVCEIDSWREVPHSELSLALCDDPDAGMGTGEGGARGRGYMCNYRWFTLLYGRNQHNSVKN